MKFNNKIYTNIKNNFFRIYQREIVKFYKSNVNNHNCEGVNNGPWFIISYKKCDHENVEINLHITTSIMLNHQPHTLYQYNVR